MRLKRIGFSGTINSRLENVEVRNQGYHGFLGVENSELINLNVHHNGLNAGLNAPYITASATAFMVTRLA